jgi:hypothetical protein
MYAGNTKRIIVTVFDAANNEVSLIDYDIFLSVKPNHKSSYLLFEKTLQNGIDILKSNQFLITLHPNDTKNLIGTYYYECCIANGDKVHTVAAGNLIICGSDVAKVIK